MSKHTDISQQIWKYLNGELDGRAMHSLERQAQDDPFVLDALEGYTISGKNQHANLTELAGRLKQKIQPVTGRIVRWRNLSVAASIIGALLAIAGIWMMKAEPEKNEKKLALQEKTEVLKPQTAPLSKDTVTEVAIGQADVIVQQPANKSITPNNAVKSSRPAAPAIAESEIKADAEPQQPSDNMSLEEVIVLNYDKAAKQDKRINDGYVSRVDSAGVGLPGRAALAAQGNNEKAKALNQGTKASNIISGTVTDATGPLPGVRVRIKGTDISSITDIRGRFSLPVEQPKRVVLDADMIGYLNKQVKVNAKDSVVIAMKAKQGVSGGVITGYGAYQCCRDVYEKYLKDNAISPDGKAGTVKLSFVVNPDNSLSDFTVLKGLSEETNKKAIEIVKNGPPWVHDPSGKPKSVTLKIKFAAKR